jgi:triphosphoribosyl-dephospho-CoA synthase
MILTPSLPTIVLHAQLACIWEVTARKAGNVHPYAAFPDLDYNDFLTASAVLADALRSTSHSSVGMMIFTAAYRGQTLVRSNVHLGILLLLAPLVKTATIAGLRGALPGVLDGIDIHDTGRVYEAIRRVRPGGLGNAPEQDVAQRPTVPLRQAMALAADRDLIARQYANGFREVFDEVVPVLCAGLDRTGCLEGAIIWTQLNFMAEHPDSLILRKRGADEAEESRRRAAEVLEAGWPEKTTGREAFAAFDAWLRAVGHQRNPGTTADLIAAGLFVALHESTIPLPCPWPWTTPGFAP